MTSGLHFDVQVKGCAAVAFKIEESRTRLEDAKRILLETDKQLCQAHEAYRGIATYFVAAASPRVPERRVTRSIPKVDIVGRDEGQVMSGFANLLGDTLGDTPPLSVQYSVDTLQKSSWGSPTSHAFTPALTIPRLAHLQTSELPSMEVERGAANFVATWREEDRIRTLQENLIRNCLTARFALEVEEKRRRHRLRQLLLTQAELILRFSVEAEYDKFYVFCTDHEPVWRQAAVQLHRENVARLDRTENVYARVVMQEVAVTEKQRIFQETADCILSHWLTERERYRVRFLCKDEAARRYLQEPKVRSELLVPLGRAHPHTHRRDNAAAREGGWAGPQVPPRLGGGLTGSCTAAADAGISKVVEALSAVEVSPPRKRRESTRKCSTNSTRGTAMSYCRKPLTIPTTGHHDRGKDFLPSLSSSHQYSFNASVSNP